MRKSTAEIALKLLNGPPPFKCADCHKRPAWFDPRFGKAICDVCWKTGNYSERIRAGFNPSDMTDMA